jgi:hypothetical protein
MSAASDNNFSLESKQCTLILWSPKLISIKAKQCCSWAALNEDSM